MNNTLYENEYFERIDCPVCGSNKLKIRNSVNFSELKQKKSMELSSIGVTAATKITVDVCDECEFVFVNPRIKSEYQHLLYNEHKTINPEKVTIRNGVLPADMRRRRVSAALSVLQLVPELNNNEAPVVFDYGCGFGHALTLADSMGMNTYGVDLDESRVKFCGENGLKVTSVGDFHNKYGDIKADAIFLLSTLEHIVNLNEVFEFIESLSKNGTVLVLDGFTPKTIDVEQKAKKYVDAHFIEHINFFKIGTLDRMMKRYSYQPMKRNIAKQITSYKDIVKLAGSYVMSNSFNGSLLNHRKFFTRVYTYS